MAVQTLTIAQRLKGFAGNLINFFGIAGGTALGAATVKLAAVGLVVAPILLGFLGVMRNYIEQSEITILEIISVIFTLFDALVVFLAFLWIFFPDSISIIGGFLLIWFAIEVVKFFWNWILVPIFRFIGALF